MRVRAIATRNEIRADRILRRTLADTDWLLSANVTIQSVLEREEHMSDAAFSMFTRGSFDFVVYDNEEYRPAFVVEVDGFGHDDPKQITRDLLKNAFCARAGLPLLRVGTDSLRELDETSVLEWLASAYVAFEREIDEEFGAHDDESFHDEVLDDRGDPAADEEPALGEDGFTFEAEHPFPDNALVASRLLDRHGIALVDASAFVVPDSAAYVLRVSWVGRAPAFRDGPASTFVKSVKDFELSQRDRLTAPLLVGLGRAEFAVDHKMPAGVQAQLAAVEAKFPWDPWGVAAELALYDVLRQAERWACRHLSDGAKRHET